jgi:hypothetical protein
LRNEDRWSRGVNRYRLASPRAEWTGALDQLEATQARAAAAEARLERAQEREWAHAVTPLELAVDYAAFARYQRFLAVNVSTGHYDEKTGEWVPFGERFPRTLAHDAISDQAAARLLNDD